MLLEEPCLQGVLWMLSCCRAPQLCLVSSEVTPCLLATRAAGGLSMFLTGQLEHLAVPAAAAAGEAIGSGAAAAPAWGARVAAPAGATSLKQILDQEAATSSQPRMPPPPLQQQAVQGSASKPLTPGGLRLTPGSGEGLQGDDASAGSMLPRRCQC